MEKIKEVDWRGIYKTATQKVKKYTLNLTDLELKVEEATNAETWGPHGSVMNQIADDAFDPENYRQIMGVLARRLQEKDENWRMCYKALLLLEHLIKHGPGKIVGDVQSSAGVLDRLTNFQYKDANMKDHGVNVRHRAQEILQLVNDPQRLREERDKAKSNRQKYRGVSADQMRSGGGGGGGGGLSGFGGASLGGSSLGGRDSFGRSSSDRYAAGTSGSLYGASSGGGLGVSRRTDSYDETEHDSHYISKRPPGADAPPAGSSAGAAGAAGPGEDAVAATRARIEKMRLGEEHRPAAGAAGGEGADHKKKLTDVRVNPKIAASLGLKIPAPQPPKPAAAAAAPAAAATTSPAADLDLLGGLDAEPAAPAAAPAASFDPFAAPAAAAPAAAASAPQPSWDAFGGAPAAPGATAAPAGGSPLNLLDFGGMPSPAAAPVPSFQQPSQPAAPADPFAAFSSPAPAAPAPLAGLGGFGMAAPARPAAPAAAPPPAVAAGVTGALPEDMFSDLTGIGKPKPPMGHAPPLASASPAGHANGGNAMGNAAGGGWGLPAAPAPAGLSPPSPGLGGGFGDFSTPFVSAAAPSGGGMGLGMGVQQQQQQGPPTGHARSGSMGRSADFGSFSYGAAPQGGASAADPFADLLK